MKPRMAFIGVRSSWLTLARKRDFASLACSSERLVSTSLSASTRWPSISVANRSLGDVLTSETVAIEIARSAVGGIALALSVPLTTAIAAVLATPGGARTAHVSP